MTQIKTFALTHSRADNYAKVHQAMLSHGRAIDETPADSRQGVNGAAAFFDGSVSVYTNQDKRQVVMAEKVKGSRVDPNFIPDDVDTEVAEQTYRSVMKPDEFGVLHVKERVDSRSSDGTVLGSWIRDVETDPNSNAFAIIMP